MALLTELIILFSLFSTNISPPMGLDIYSFRSVPKRVHSRLIYMKLLTLISIFAITIGKTFSQTVAVAATNTNVFYQWLDNPVIVVVENCPCKNIVVQTNKGTLTGSGCQYIYKAENDVFETTIKVGVKSQGIIKWVNESNYRVKPLPDPMILIGGVRSSGKMFKSELLGNRNISVPCEEFGAELTPCQQKQQIINYTLVVSRKGSIIFESKDITLTDYPNMPDNAIDFIDKHCISGDVLTFDNITCLMYKKERRKLSPYILTIATP